MRVNYFRRIRLDIFSIGGILLMAQIIVVDILLAGDNAVVIGMAARNLPHNLQKKAIFWGTFGAIVLRLVMAFLFVEALNNIPYLRIVGGVLLLWIAYSLMVEDDQEHDIEAKNNLMGAITTIVIADGVMSIDNVLAVVGTAKGHMLYVMIGMLITVPIIIWGSTVFIKLIERYKFILFVGGGTLGWVAGNMIVEDQMLVHFMEAWTIPFSMGCAILVLVAAVLRNKFKGKIKDREK